jgi:hypothetical protein
LDCLGLSEMTKEVTVRCVLQVYVYASEGV